MKKNDLLTSKYATPSPLDWVFIAKELLMEAGRCVLVFVRSHAGSTPRETGAWVIVSERQTFGTLGGGEIERTVIIFAQDMLAGKQEFKRNIQNFNLGPDLEQCCGGLMSTLFEPLDDISGAWLGEASFLVLEGSEGYVIFPVIEKKLAPQVLKGALSQIITDHSNVHIQNLIDYRPRVVLYGAGHVGRAIASVSLALPIQLLVVDSREIELDKIPLSRNIKITCSENPVLHANENFCADAALIMTHSHGLDYRLCQVLIEKDDLVYIGLIGSKTKAAKFRNALSLEGKMKKQISRLTCPIGKGGPHGKEPGTIALSVLFELLNLMPSHSISNSKNINVVNLN